MATLARRRRGATAPVAAGAPARRTRRGRPARARAARAEYELLVEAIYEGYLLHYGSRASCRRRRPTSACWPATGSTRSGSRGSSRSATRGRGRARRHDHAQRARAGRRRAELPTRVWAAGARAVGWGSSEPTARPRSWCCAGAPEAIEAMRTSAAGPPAPPLNRASILLAPPCPTSTHKHKSKYTLDRHDPGRLRGRDGHAPAVHDRHRQGAGAIAAASFALPALGFAIGPIFKSTPHSLGSRRARPTCSPTTTTCRS